jgi:ribose 5-phosphate isomerase A
MQDYKKEAARAAVALIRPGSTVGFGAGSTIAHLIGFIKDDATLASSIHTVTSSAATRLLLERSALPVKMMGVTARIDQYFDGCDQFDAELNALKSGAGIHTLEKVAAAMAREFILIGDESKYVERLDGKYSLVIEVIPEALSYVLARMRELFEGSVPAIRMDEETDRMAISGHGNYLVDCWFARFPEPGLLNEKVGLIPGVLEHSLFYGMAHKAILAGEQGTIIKTRS